MLELAERCIFRGVFLAPPVFSILYQGLRRLGVEKSTDWIPCFFAACRMYLNRFFYTLDAKSNDAHSSKQPLIEGQPEGVIVIIGIADPQTRVRFSLRILLEQQPGWIIGGEAADCLELFELLKILSPDLLLMDWDLPDLPAETLLRLLRAQRPGTQIIVMSGRQELSRAAMKAGGDAFICKTESPEKLLNLIRDLQDKKGCSHGTIENESVDPSGKEEK